MYAKAINITVPGGEAIALPRMVDVEQRFPQVRVTDIREGVEKALAALPRRPDVAGKRIAITGGSRGISGGVAVYRALADRLKEWGAEPFLIPAMGSHGNGTADGQKATLASYGLTEESVGVPVLASMDVVQTAKTDDGVPLYCDRNAYEADGIVVVNKIKPHTSFKGDHESGLCKMMIIGLGKHEGATRFHSIGFGRFAEVLPKAAKAQLEALPVLFGLALVENAYDGLGAIEAIPPENIVVREKELLIKAKDIMGKLLMSSIDVLIVDEFGKNISGQGMDSNVTGRSTSGLPGFVAPPITRIVVRNLTPESHGNAVGLGVADMITLKMFNEMDLGAVYTNSITSRNTDCTRIPMITNDDRQAITIAVRTCLGVDPAAARIVRIKNTKALHRIQMSEPYLDEIRGREEFAILGQPKPLTFDARGTLID